MLLPLLFLLLFGGLAVLQVGRWIFEVDQAAQQGLLLAEALGGVDMRVDALVQRDLGTDPGLQAAAVRIEGSAPVVPWGDPIWLTVTVQLPSSFPLSLLSPVPQILSTRLVGTSNAPPP